MLFWKKKSPEKVSLDWLHADMHSHLVAGIDDGAADVATAVALIREMKSLGYGKIVTTPHVLWELYPNTTATIQQGAARVQQALDAEGIDIDYHAAAEYYMDEHFAGLLQKKEPLLTIGGNMVLVEFSMITAPFDLQEMLFEMQLQHYQPVIAHPERYAYLKHRKEFFEELRHNGCLFQLNLLSLTGHYGHTVQELAEYLVKGDFYDFAGTDLHGERHLAGLQQLGGSPLLRRLKESGRLKNATL